MLGSPQTGVARAGRDERRLVERVLRHWTQLAARRRFPRVNEIDRWMRGDDRANCVLIAVQSPVELSHFSAVGENLAVALCPRGTLAGVLLSHLPWVVSSRCRGRGNASGGADPLSRRAAPNIRRWRHDRPCAGRGEPSRAARGRCADEAGHQDTLGLDRGSLLENTSHYLGRRVPLALSPASSAGRARISALKPERGSGTR
jgi:hypothetical protein